ncbi:MAG TPA: HDOD domain-containing protein [Polyangiaceae bacterium]|nr:HDOD domain-containing protein [Polyangiaceae bacterium]
MLSIDALLDRVVEVCPLSATTQRVLALTSGDTASIPEVARVISTDPALAAAVLSVANSAAYGMGKVDRLEVAVMRLGLRELHNLAAAMALFAAFRSKAELSLQLHELCVASGSLAHRIAKETGVAQPGSAFVCGLLSEIGAMACLVFDGKPYVELFRTSGADIDLRAQREVERYGASSFAIGQRFLERNSLPESVCYAVGSDVTAPQDWEPLAKITLLARHAPLLQRVHAADRGALDAALDALAGRIALENVDGARLRDMCKSSRAADALD